MIQGLFLDGINLQRGWRAVAQAVELAALIDSYEAESGLAGTDVAVARAEIAVNFPVRLRLPPASLVKFPRFLEDLQLFHGPSSPNQLYACLPSREVHGQRKLDEGLIEGSRPGFG